jgi:predicted nucleic acid-binding protein
VNRLVLLDNEMVQALRGPSHRKHQRALDEAQIVFNRAAIAKRTGASVADAYLGAVIQAADAGHVTVITSDPGDMRKVAEGRQVNVVAL